MDEKMPLPWKVKEVLKTFMPNDDKLDLIYHYTSFDVLKRIIETEQLRLTQYSYLNDTSEIKHSIDCFSKNIFNTNNLSNDKEQFCEKQIAALTRCPFYIISFCAIKNYLPAWRFYADKNNDGVGGVAIGFSYREIVKDLFPPKPFHQPNLEQLFSKVLYVDPSDYNWEQEKNGKLRQLYKSYEKSDINLGMLNLGIRSLFPLIKHSCYTEEEEVRLSISNLDYHGNNSEPFFEEIIEDGKSRIKIPINLNWLKEIWTSPNFKIIPKDNVLNKIIECKKNLQLQIHHSSLPYDVK